MSLIATLPAPAPTAEASAAEVRPAHDPEDDGETLAETWAELEAFAGLRHDIQDAIGAAGEH